MRIILTLFSFLLLTFSCVSLQGQEFDEDISIDEKYSPPKGSVFETDYIGSSAYYHYTEHKNAFKYGLSSLARGCISYDYERNLDDYLNVQLGLGLTFFPDLVQGAFLSIVEDLPLASPRGVGTYIGFEGKYYFEYLFDGIYFGLGIRNFTYQNKFAKSPSNDPINPSLEFKEKNMDVYLTYGYTAYYNEKTIGEFSMNIGARRVQTFTLANGSSPSYSLEPFNSWQYSIFFTYKIGFGFNY